MPLLADLIKAQDGAEAREARGTGAAGPPLSPPPPPAYIPLPPPPPAPYPPLYLVPVPGGWLNLAAYARFVEGDRGATLRLYPAGGGDPATLTGDAASAVRRHLGALAEPEPRGED